MSYYTIIEDIPIIEEALPTPVVYVDEVPVFKDWPTVTVIFYLLILLFGGSIFAWRKDN